MRLRFWRRDEPVAFDLAAGEVPEHLEVYPPGKPFPWRAVSAGWTAALVSFTVLLGWRAYDRAHSDPGPLVATEAAALVVVCSDSTHFLTLSEFAPCDADSWAKLGLDRIEDYYVVTAVRLGSKGHVGNKRAYLVSRACYDRSLSVLAPIDECVVATLDD